MSRCAVFSILCLAAFTARAQTVVCFGDSLTAGVGAPEGGAYPDFLRADLAAAGFHATVVNQGLGGETADQARGKLDPVLQAHPAVVVLELGANDALANRPLPAIRHDLGAIIEALQKARIPVILAGYDPRPFAGLNLPPKFRTPYMQQFYGLDGELARRYRVPLIPSLLEGVSGVPGRVSPDGLHPNQDGYEKVAATVLPYVETVLKRETAKRK